MELFQDSEALDEGERQARLAMLRNDLAEIEIRRRFLHERIDLLRAERVRRLGRLRRAGLLVVDRESPPPPRRLFTGKGEVSTEPLGGLPDVSSLGDDELHALIKFLKSLEDDVSLQRRVLHHRIDALPR
jgi:anti-sigma-K factor RsiG